MLPASIICVSDESGEPLSKKVDIGVVVRKMFKTVPPTDAVIIDDVEGPWLSSLHSDQCIISSSRVDFRRRMIDCKYGGCI